MTVADAVADTETERVNPMGTTSRWLLFDEAGYGFKGVRHSGVGARVAVLLPSTAEPAGITEWLTYREVVAERMQTWAYEGTLLEDIPCGAPPGPVFTGLPFDLRPDALPVVSDGRRLIPVALVAEREGDGGTTQDVYVCSRIRQSGMLFSRIWTDTSTGALSVPEAVRVASEREPALVARFSDESAQTVRFDEDTEIELKFTLRDGTSPWALACDLAGTVQARGLPGFIPDIGNEMQRWTYEQDTFEVVGPRDKTGYVAFMTAHDGTHTVKYKFFARDMLRRVERFDKGVRLKRSEFTGYLLAAIDGAEIRALPHLTRTRFDVNVESARTGHFFGLEVDEVRAGNHVLRQLEIEYHKSRACPGVEAGTIEPELFRLSEEVRGLLGTWDVRAELGYFSKLSFLKQVAAVSPMPAH